ncbi:NHL repeat-containing protein [Acidobacteria bacterium AH-259-G07]|nr:NHL repeat-containing protein [Acidobacteria bacterium AH-259-G07]
MNRQRFYLALIGLALCFSCSGPQRPQLDFELIAEWGNEDLFGDPFSVQATTENVYVSDSYRGEILVFDPAGKLRSSIGKAMLVTPAGISVSREGHLYVADPNQDKVFEFSPQGSVLRVWPQDDSNSKGLDGPVAVAPGPNGETVFVLEFSGHRVKAFYREGHLKRSWGGRGKEEGRFYSAGDLRVFTNGEIFVSDTHNYRIQVFSVDGKFLRSWGSRKEFDDPAGIDFDKDGYVFIADSGNHRVQVWDRQGKFLTSYAHPSWQSEQVSSRSDQGEHEGSHTSSKGEQVSSPLDLSFDARGTLYVLDVARKKIQKFALR